MKKQLIKKQQLNVWTLLFVLLLGGTGNLLWAESQTLHNPFASLLLPDSSLSQKQKKTSASFLKKVLPQKQLSQRGTLQSTNALELIGIAQISNQKLALIQKKELRYWLEQGQTLGDLQVVQILSDSVLFQNAQGEKLHLEQH